MADIPNLENQKYILPKLNELVLIAIKAEKDASKFDGGNSRAGKRVRVEMQKIRKMAKEIRFIIQEERKKRKDAKKVKVDKLPESY